MTFNLVNEKFELNVQPLSRAARHESSDSDILDLLSGVLCRHRNSFYHKIEEQGKVCNKWCYLSIWLSTFVLCGIITRSSVDTNVPHCCLWRLLREDSLTCLLNRLGRKLLAFHSRDLCQQSGKTKLGFCFLSLCWFIFSSFSSGGTFWSLSVNLNTSLWEEGCYVRSVWVAGKGQFLCQGWVAGCIDKVKSKNKINKKSGSV